MTRMDARQSITHLLQTAGEDSPALAAELFPIVYDQLRQLATQMMAKLPPKQTLQPTALVHEAYLRLVAIDAPDWKSRRHFFRTAARAMRFILVDQARRKATAKHGARVSDHDPEQLSIEVGSPPEELLALHEALEQRLEIHSPPRAPRARGQTTDPSSSRSPGAPLPRRCFCRGGVRPEPPRSERSAPPPQPRRCAR